MRTTLLLVGDESAMGGDIALALIDAGYLVRTAASGEEALAELAGVGERPVDLVLSGLPVAPAGRLTSAVASPTDPDGPAGPATAAGTTGTTEVTGPAAVNSPAEVAGPTEVTGPPEVTSPVPAGPMDGLEFCRRVRAAGDLPIMMVAGRPDQARVIAGLEAGADDCVTAPPVTAEVLARIRALLRRVRAGSSSAPADLSVGDLQIRPAEGVVRRGGEDQHLTRTEFRLLCELAVAGGRVVSRKQLMQRVWGYDDYFGSARMLDVHVRRLRRKVEADPSAPTHILTVRGVGYRVCS